MMEANKMLSICRRRVCKESIQSWTNIQLPNTNSVYLLHGNSRYDKKSFRVNSISTTY